MTSSLKPFAVPISDFVEKPASDWRAAPGAEPETVLRSPRSDSGEPILPTFAPEVPSVWRRLFSAPSEGSATAAAADPAQGMVLGHFTIVRRIGAGAMGAVFLAHDDRLHRHVALKILSPLQAADVSTVQRFQNEAQAAARLDHDHVARVYYYGEEGGLHFIAYEYIPGINLRDLLMQRGKLAPAEVVNFAIQIATALRHTARNGVVHRDIKPSNIIVTPRGRAKLVDLGLAKRDGNEPGADLTVAGTTLGTFDYISPEQARDPRTVDVRSDLYSLGCTLYHLLTGEPPYPSGTVLQKLLDHQAHDTPDVAAKNRRISPALSAIVRKLMASDPKRRYATPEELLRDLAVVARDLELRVVSSESATLVPESRLRGSWWDRNFGWLITAAALLLSVVTLYTVPNLLERLAVWSSPVNNSEPPGSSTVNNSPPPKSIGVFLPDEVLLSNPITDDLSDQIVATTSEESKTVLSGPTTDTEPPSVDSSDTDTESGGAKNTTAAEALKTAAANAVESSTEPTVVPSVAPAAVPAEVSAPLISIVGSTSKTGYSSLEQACAEAKDGDIIELRGTASRIITEHSLRLIDKRLTIRAANRSGKGTTRPQWEIADTDRSTDATTASMITVSGGSLQLVNIDLITKVNPASAGAGWTLFSLERPEQLKLEGVTLTVVNPARRQASVIELGSAAGTSNGKLRIGLPSLPPEILVSRSVIRGAATLMVVREALSARFAIADSVIALDETLLQMAARPSMNNDDKSQLNLDLTHTTLLLGGSLAVARQDSNLSDRPVPLFVTAQNNLISIGRDQPLVELAGGNVMELSDSFKWAGSRNGYDDIRVFWISQKNVPLDFNAWKSQWGAANTGSTNVPIRWKTPVKSLVLQNLGLDDVALESTGTPNPAIEAADDGTDLGAPLTQLPSPPKLDEGLP